MRVSVNWLKEFTDIDISVDDLVKKIGAQLGAVEEVIDLGKQYEGAVIAKIVSCQKHPNADKLSVCIIDDGGAVPDVTRDANGFVQVVCGAPNVREGLLVAWLPPGAIVPSTFSKDPFKLMARELRGVVSNGMLASPAELNIGSNHDGLLEVDEDTKPGQSFAKVYGLDDHIIDIENKMFTHRPDCFGILGVAREVAGIQAKKFTSPDWYMNTPDFIKGPDQLKLGVHNELPELVPRFMLVTVADVQIKPSPIKLQSYLTKVGIKPINNVVDITNYVMYITGQPLHAYDYDKVKALSDDEAKLVVRHPREGETIKLLNGKTIEPRKEAIMIATDKELIGIGGVMGGTTTEVDENTKNIILECANFDMYSIRRTSMAHGLFTDAVTRFTKGQSPLQNDRVLAYALKQIEGISGGKQTREVIDESDKHKIEKSVGVVPIHIDFIRSRLGITKLMQSEVATYLNNVEFVIGEDDGAGQGQIFVNIPFWRTDIEIPEDIVEEVGRLYGYDHVPLDLPKRSIVPVAPDAELRTKDLLRGALSRSGANEVLTYSFVNSKLFEKSGQDSEEAYRISNALSPDLQYYRLSLAPSLLSLVHPNIKLGYSEFALFEIGKVHGKSQQDEDGLPKEFGRVSLVCSVQKKVAVSSAPYYQAKHYLETLLTEFSIKPTFVPLEKSDIKGHKLFDQLCMPFDPKRSAVVYNGEKLLGVVGEFKSGVVRSFKLPTHSAGFEMFLSAFNQQTGSKYQPLSRFPGTEQDLCLRVSSQTTYEVVFEEVRKLADQHKPEDVVVVLSPVDIYQNEDDQDHKQITLRLHLVSYERTLTADVANKLLDTIAEATKASLQAVRV